MTALILAVDGGRSHLRASLFTEEGELLAHLEEAGISPNLAGIEDLAPRLAALPGQLAELAQVEVGSVRIAAAGLAGFGREEACRQLESRIGEISGSTRWLIESDAAQTLRAANPSGPAVVAILGTGSAFFARDCQGQIHRTGGWGALLEDAGSGFEIARQGILTACRAFDGMLPPTSLAQSLCQFAGCNSLSRLLPLLYGGELAPASWARFAPVVLQAAAVGDAAAEKVVKNQAAAVVDHLVVLIRKAGLPHGTAVHFHGGIVNGCTHFFLLLQQIQPVTLASHPFALLEREPLWGGYERAKGVL